MPADWLADIDAAAGAWSLDDWRRAFVAGAKWWEYVSRNATMWPDDQRRAEAEAERRYDVGGNAACSPERIRALVAVVREVIDHRDEACTKPHAALDAALRALEKTP